MIIRLVRFRRRGEHGESTWKLDKEIATDREASRARVRVKDKRGKAMKELTADVNRSEVKDLKLVRASEDKQKAAGQRVQHGWFWWPGSAGLGHA